MLPHEFIASSILCNSNIFIQSISSFNSLKIYLGDKNQTIISHFYIINLLISIGSFLKFYLIVGVEVSIVNAPLV
jgi:hypothetical protein